MARARVNHVPASQRTRLRAATGHVACSVVTWSLARAGRSVLATPPLLLRPLPLAERLLLPSVRLLNCNRLSFTQIPPFEQNTTPLLKITTPTPPASAVRAVFRPLPSCRSTLASRLPCPRPWGRFLLIIGGLPLRAPPLVPLPGSHCLRRCLLVQLRCWGCSVLGDTLLFFSSRRPAAENGVLEFCGLFFPL